MSFKYLEIIIICSKDLSLEVKHYVLKGTQILSYLQYVTWKNMVTIESKQKFIK